MTGPLVDTSVLVDFFNGRPSPEADLLQALMEDGPAPALVPSVLQEFLQGLTRPGEVAKGLDYLERFIQLPSAGYAVHERAAALHRALRVSGHTPGTVDALIVATAAHAARPLLTSDRVQIRLCAEAGVLAL